MNLRCTLSHLYILLLFIINRLNIDNVSFIHSHHFLSTLFRNKRFSFKLNNSNMEKRVSIFICLTWFLEISIIIIVHDFLTSKVDL